MRTGLDHLTVAKRQELSRVVAILFDEFERALASRTAPRRRAGRILKVVLFGSYARGDWVADPEGGYFSDFDLLIVVNEDELADAEYWRAAEDHLLRDLEAGALRTQVNLIVHSLADVNSRLRRGRPFFVDIARDGIALHGASDHPFDSPASLSTEATAAEATAFFEQWFSMADAFLRNAGYARRDGDLKLCAFLLHQSVERLYHCVLNVLTLYSPKGHKLNLLRSQAERVAPSLVAAWPRETRFAQRSFEMLRRAYVDARYSPSYRITAEEIDWLFDRIGLLRTAVDEACREWIDGLRRVP